MCIRDRISQEDYDRWRYHYPEYDGSQMRAKVPPEGLILSLIHI